MTFPPDIADFTKPQTLTLGGRLIELRRPIVMGILNATPDSFHEESRIATGEEAVERAGKMLEEGATIIDIGGCSTRPGSWAPDPDEEIRRLKEVVAPIRAEFPEAIISIDTFRASVAREFLEKGEADIINDVSGGRDPEMMDIVASYKAGYVIMHMRGSQTDMDSHCSYEDVVADVIRELAFTISEARKRGICNIIADPGFGFAKTLSQNYRILERLEEFRILGCPLLVGMSRKRMTRETTGGEKEDSLTATIALNAVAISKGASIIRVHDVKEGAITASIAGQLW